MRPLSEPEVVVGDRFVAAVAEAVQLHAGQARKGSDVPYVSHLLAVAGLVLEHGGDEDQAIAALLHDGPEDQGGQADARGDPRAVRSAVSPRSWPPAPTPSSRRSLRGGRGKRRTSPTSTAKGPDVWPVALADKVHNARTIVADLRAHGPATLDRFNGGRDGTVWYYGTLAERLGRLAGGPLADELVALATEMRELAER